LGNKTCYAVHGVMINETSHSKVLRHYSHFKHVTAALFQVTLKCIHSADMFTC